MNKERWIRFCIAVGLGLAGVALAQFGCAAANGSAADSSSNLRCVLVEITLAKARVYAPKVTLTGGIEPRFSNNIAFRIGGRIDQRFVEVGDHITAGQVLARIDPQVERANVATANASLASAQALLTQAHLEFKRQEALLKNGFTTRPAYDQAQLQLKTEEAAVQSAKAAIGTAEEQLSYTELKAGVSGIITARNGEVGQVVQAGQTVFTVAQDGQRDAVFDVYESLLTDPPSRTAEVYLQADPTVTTTGTVREISPTVDPETGTVRLKIGLNSVPARMSLGAAVVGVGTFRPRRVIMLPRGALFRWRNAPAVWLLDRNSRRVTPKVIQIDRYTGNELVLSGGITTGDAVVVAGIQFLHPGQIVEIAKPGQEPP
jgi:membrane fusion protein, multidrug efflux system